MKRFIGLPGGPSFADAVHDAEIASFAAMADAREEMARIICEIVRFSACAAAPDFAKRARLAAITNDALTMAGLLGWTDIAIAMRTLHAMVDDLNNAGAWDAEAVAVNCRAIGVVSQGQALSQGQRVALLEGMAKVAEKARRAAALSR